MLVPLSTQHSWTKDAARPTEMFPKWPTRFSTKTPEATHRSAGRGIQRWRECGEMEPGVQKFAESPARTIHSDPPVGNYGRTRSGFASPGHTICPVSYPRLWFTATQRQPSPQKASYSCRRTRCIQVRGKDDGRWAMGDGCILPRYVPRHVCTQDLLHSLSTIVHSTAQYRGNKNLYI